MRTFKINPGSVVRMDFDVDWSAGEEEGGPWLPPGDAIATSAWTFTTTGTLTVDGDEKTATTTKVWLTGGTLGETATLTNRVITNQGRRDKRTFAVTVVDR